MTRQEKLVALAKRLVGVPYEYGVLMEKAPAAFDCSSFTKYLFGELGIDIPRSTIEQAEFTGQTLPDASDLEIGDLIFLHGERGHYSPETPEGVGHVAVYVGNDNVVSATAERTGHWPDQITEVGEVREEPLQELLRRSGPVVRIKRVL